MLVSENNTSYGKDLGDIRLLETLLPELAAVDGIERVRVSYLQPAEMRPGLIDVLTSTDEGRAVLRPVLPALRARRAARDAPLRRHRPLPGAAGDDPRQGAAGGRPVQLHRRLPRRDRGGRRRAGALPHRARGWTPSASSATPTRTAPKPPAYEDKIDAGRRRRAAGAHLAARRGADRAARRGAARRDRRGARRVRRAVDGRTRTRAPRAAAAHQAPETDGQVLCTAARAWLPVGRIVEAKVVGTRGCGPGRRAAGRVDGALRRRADDRSRRPPRRAVPAVPARPGAQAGRPRRSVRPACGTSPTSSPWCGCCWCPASSC